MKLVLSSCNGSKRLEAVQNGWKQDATTTKKKTVWPKRFVGFKPRNEMPLSSRYISKKKTKTLCYLIIIFVYTYRNLRISRSHNNLLCTFYIHKYISIHQHIFWIENFTRQQQQQQQLLYWHKGLSWSIFKNTHTNSC